MALCPSGDTQHTQVPEGHLIHHCPWGKNGGGRVGFFFLGVWWEMTSPESALRQHHGPSHPQREWERGLGEVLLAVTLPEPSGRGF